jgi:hypothetical protein
MLRIDLVLSSLNSVLPTQNESGGVKVSTKKEELEAVGYQI